MLDAGRTQYVGEGEGSYGEKREGGGEESKRGMREGEEGQGIRK